MSKRTRAKAALLAYVDSIAPDFIDGCLKDRKYINLPTAFRENCHNVLADAGYANPATRTCIMNETWRELGIQKPRDTYRQKIYDFEDAVLYPAVNNHLLTLTEAKLIASMTADLIFIQRPEVVIEDNKRNGLSISIARDGKQVILSPNTMNICTLCHELSHIYLQQNGDENTGHTAKFMAIQIVLIARFCDANFDELLKLCLDHKAPVDKEFACNLNRVTPEL